MPQPVGNKWKSSAALFSSLDVKYAGIESTILIMSPKLSGKETCELDPFSPKTVKRWEWRRKKNSIVGCLFIISMYGCPLFKKLFAESGELRFAIVWERHCIVETHFGFRALQKFTNRIVCDAAGKTWLHRCSALPKWIPCKIAAVTVWQAELTETRNTQHAIFLFRVQLLAFEVCCRF